MSWRRNAGLTLAAAGLTATALEVWRASRRADLRGDSVLITGGSRGLGLLLAEEFGRLGCRVAICARDEAELARAQEHLRAQGATVTAHICDVSDRRQVAWLVSAIEAEFGGIDILVNNAGTIQVGPLETMTPEDFERAMAVTFYGAMYATMAVLPGMRRRRYGRIVTIDSIGGRLPAPHLAPYTAAKFALRGLSQGLAVECPKDGITVTTIYPGLMRTGSPLHAQFKGRAATEFAWFALGDSLPVVSIDARRAARQIVDATREGRAEFTVGIAARLAGMAHDLAPSLSLHALALVDRLLPGPAPGSDRLIEGRELGGNRLGDLVNRLLRGPARRTNETTPAPR